jgi:ketosteroid isomerase-like protein
MSSTTEPTATGATSAPDANAPRIVPGITETNRRFESAFAQGDPARAALEVYTRDARVMPPGAATVRGREAAAQFWTAAAAQMGISAVALETVDLQLVGEGAYEIGRGTLTLTGGQQVVAKYVVIWRQEEGRWRWHVDIWNLEP